MVELTVDVGGLTFDVDEPFTIVDGGLLFDVGELTIDVGGLTD